MKSFALLPQSTSSKSETIDLYGLRKLLRVYELLRPHFPADRLIDDIEFHAKKGGIAIEEKDGEIQAVAFVWHIDDPYDLVEREYNYPGENPSGKYLYLPLIFIRKEKRGYPFLKAFLKKILKNYPSSRRIVFRREAPRDDHRLHILMKVNRNGTTASTVRN